MVVRRRPQEFVKIHRQPVDILRDQLLPSWHQLIFRSVPEGRSQLVARFDTWTRAAKARFVRWVCTCGAINPDMTRTCIRCG